MRYVEEGGDCSTPSRLTSPSARSALGSLSEELPCERDSLLLCESELYEESDATLLLLWIVHLKRAMPKVHHWIQMFSNKKTADGKFKDTKTTGYCEKM